MFKKRKTQNPPRLHKKEEQKHYDQYVPIIIRILLFLFILIILLKLCFMYVPPTYGYFSHWGENMIYKLEDNKGNYFGVKNKALAFIILTNNKNPFNKVDIINDECYDEPIIESVDDFYNYFYW